MADTKMAAKTKIAYVSDATEAPFSCQSKVNQKQGNNMIIIFS